MNPLSQSRDMLLTATEASESVFMWDRVTNKHTLMVDIYVWLGSIIYHLSFNHFHARLFLSA